MNFRNLDHVAEESEAAGGNRVDLELRHLLPTPGRLERQTGNYQQFSKLVSNVSTLSSNLFLALLQSHPAYNMTFAQNGPFNTTTILVPVKPCPWICELTNDAGYVVYRWAKFCESFSQNCRIIITFSSVSSGGCMQVVIFQRELKSSSLKWRIWSEGSGRGGGGVLRSFSERVCVMGMKILETIEIQGWNWNGNYFEFFAECKFS